MSARRPAWIAEPDRCHQRQLQAHLTYAFGHAVLKDRCAAMQQRDEQIEDRLAVLTAREREVLLLLSSGRSTLDIAPSCSSRDAPSKPT